MQHRIKIYSLLTLGLCFVVGAALSYYERQDRIAAGAGACMLFNVAAF